MAMASQDHCLSAARWLAITAPGVDPDPETRMGESASEIARTLLPLLRSADAEVAHSTNSSIDTTDATRHSLARRRSRGWVNGAHAGTYHRLQH
jgi:hypothetical protein